MHLFRITTNIWGKDLDETLIVGYVLKPSSSEVFDHIDLTYHRGHWAEIHRTDKQTLVDSCGDGEDEYRDGCLAEFHGQSYSWENLGWVTPEHAEILKQLGVIAK